MFLFLVTFVVATLTLLLLAKRGKRWSLRKMPGVEAIDEAIGRAAEMAKPVFWSPGDESDLKSAYAPQVIASLSVLSHVAKLCARYKAKLICSVGGSGSAASEVFPLVQETVHDAFLSEGRLEDFKPENIRYMVDRIPWALANMGWMYREGIASGIWIGAWAGTWIPVGATAARLGAIQIGGTARVSVHIATMTCIFDYVLIGEEIFAAGAQVSGDPIKISTVVAQDIGRCIAVALMLIGSILLWMGSPIVINLLRR